MEQEKNILDLLNSKTPFQQKYIADGAKSLFDRCVSYCKYYDIYENTKPAFKTLKNYVHDPFGESIEQQSEEKLDELLDELYEKMYAGFYLCVDNYEFDFAYFNQLEKASDNYPISAKSWENFKSSIAEYKNIKKKYDEAYDTVTDSLMKKCVLRLLNDDDVKRLTDLYDCQTPKSDVALHLTIAQIRKLLTWGKVSEYSSTSGRKKQFFKLQCGKNLNQLENYVANLDFLAEIYDECNSVFQEQVEKAQSK